MSLSDRQVNNEILARQIERLRSLQIKDCSIQLGDGKLMIFGNGVTYNGTFMLTTEALDGALPLILAAGMNTSK